MSWVCEITLKMLVCSAVRGAEGASGFPPISLLPVKMAIGSGVHPFISWIQNQTKANPANCLLQIHIIVHIFISLKIIWKKLSGLLNAVEMILLQRSVPCMVFADHWIQFMI